MTQDRQSRSALEDLREQEKEKKRILEETAKERQQAWLWMLDPIFRVARWAGHDWAQLPPETYVDMWRWTGKITERDIASRFYAAAEPGADYSIVAPSRLAFPDIYNQGREDPLAVVSLGTCAQVEFRYVQEDIQVAINRSGDPHIYFGPPWPSAPEDIARVAVLLCVASGLAREGMLYSVKRVSEELGLKKEAQERVMKAAGLFYDKPDALVDMSLP